MSVLNSFSIFVPLFFLFQIYAYLTEQTLQSSLRTQISVDARMLKTFLPENAEHAKNLYM